MFSGETLGLPLSSPEDGDEPSVQLSTQCGLNVQAVIMDESSWLGFKTEQTSLNSFQDRIEFNSRDVLGQVRDSSPVLSCIVWIHRLSTNGCVGLKLSCGQAHWHPGPMESDSGIDRWVRSQWCSISLLFTRRIIEIGHLQHGCLIVRRPHTFGYTWVYMTFPCIISVIIISI